MKDRSDNPSHHGERYISLIGQWVHHEGSIRQPIAPWTTTLTTEQHPAHSSMGPPWRIDPTTHRTMSECHISLIAHWVHHEGSTRLTIAPHWPATHHLVLHDGQVPEGLCDGRVVGSETLLVYLQGLLVQRLGLRKPVLWQKQKLNIL